MSPAGNQFGEIVLCQFPFSSGTASKIRPALVLFDLQQDVLICRVTSVFRSGPLDITLIDWQSAGLLKPSVARLDKLVTAEKKILLKRLGMLGSRDREAIRQSWNQHMRL